MLQIECQGGDCRRSVQLECQLAPDGQPCSLPDCAHLDPDAAFDRAVPDCACCPDDHHHGQAASGCPGGHGACPAPDHCPVWLGMQPHIPTGDITAVRDTS